LENIVGSFQNFKSIADKKKEVQGLVNDDKPVIFKGHDLEKYVSSMILYFESLGFVLTPYPTVEFSNEAKYDNELLGYTGHYLYDDKHIVIYTEGRHIKDIMRSLAHELVHHNQFMRGITLDNVDVMKLSDPAWSEKEEFLKHLEDYSYLEGDAYLRGNMLFRTWTDAIKQGLIQI
jgi:hypothetical protein